MRVVVVAPDVAALGVLGKLDHLVLTLELPTADEQRLLWETLAPAHAQPGLWNALASIN